MGFSYAVNQGIGVSNSDFILLLNNDTVVTKNWATRLLQGFNLLSNIGLVGPMTNHAPPPQNVAEFKYNNIDGLNCYANKWSLDHEGEFIEVPRLSAFCVMISRRLIEAIGLFDTNYGNGFYEDEDYCLRTKESGYKIILARSVYIHHYGSRTFNLLGLNIEEALLNNYNKFKAKWGQKAANWISPL